MNEVIGLGETRDGRTYLLERRDDQYYGKLIVLGHNVDSHPVRVDFDGKYVVPVHEEADAIEY